jgi:hypothetical protein
LDLTYRFALKIGTIIGIVGATAAKATKPGCFVKATVKCP